MHQAPTGIFTGPLEDIRSKLTWLAMVLMNLRFNINSWVEFGGWENQHFLKTLVLFVVGLEHPGEQATWYSLYDSQHKFWLLKGGYGYRICKGWWCKTYWELCSAHQGPKTGLINILQDSISSNIQTHWDLSSYQVVEVENAFGTKIWALLLNFMNHW